MSAELLREAAALMRERAEAASPPARPRWEAWQTAQTAEYQVGIAGRGWFGHVASPSRKPEDYGQAYAEHIASWHPAVALAVAALLIDDAACMDAATTDGFTDAAEGFELSIELARAYLGRDQ